MIKELKQQMQEQMQKTKGELIEMLQPMFEGFEIDADISEDFEVIGCVARNKNFMEKEAKETFTTVVFEFDRSKNSRVFNSKAVSLFYDGFKFPVALETTVVNLPFDFAASVFSALAAFLNSKNPIETEQKDN